MSSKRGKSRSSELLSLIPAFKHHKSRFERSFFMILNQESPIQLKQYPDEFLNAFIKIKTPGVAIKHYYRLILLLFLARNDFTDLSKSEIDFVFQEVGVALSIDVWKKITGHLDNNSDNLMYKIKLGKDTRLLFSSNKDLIKVMERLTINSQFSEPPHDYSLAIFSKSAPKDRNNVDYCLDFSNYFKAGMPTEDQWLSIEDELTTAIETIYETYFNTTLLLKESKPHSSLAFILGHSVNYFEGLKLYIYQNGQYWKYEKISENIHPSHHWTILTKHKKSENDNEINVMISVSEPIIRYVEKYLQNDVEKPKLTVHFSIKPEPQENSLADQYDALRKIDAIYTYLTRLKIKIPYIKIHLFIMAQTAFVVLLGMRLSSVALIQLYEFDQKVGNFVPNLLLDRY
ncbi:MAG: SAVED domain-containing protein [Candidatus Thorarchaeota archaeon]